MNNGDTSRLEWGRTLLIGGHFLIFVVLIIQLSVPNHFTRRVLQVNVEQNLADLTHSSGERAKVAFARLDGLHSFGIDFKEASGAEKKEAIAAWKTWWNQNKEAVEVSGFNGLVFICVLLSILGLMGLVYLKPEIYSLLVLVFCLSSVAYFVLFVHYDHSSYGPFYAFAFMMSTFTLGYLARPEVQEGDLSLPVGAQ